jgi:hypothetical protein
MGFNSIDKNDKINEAYGKIMEGKSINIIMKHTGKAIEELYNLDIKLSNGYTGDKNNKNDIAIKSLRKQLKIAMDALDSSKLISYGKNLN